ncbi:MAG: 4-demethylwyosine synthase TYW1 [Candidatus Nitrosocosmicus sp.]|jgi:tRNA wybutosine-synthesizing protein 1|uniref:4-demethylwyosine synthase TYW1 n=1 Tax=Candidatus Nitrosocosmicus agrestis TaxID=2563600 RepID=UPI00122E5ECD|nr:4-demethylwyosine synthase TYW1 [Candidatus Nitrosocosmicus sp. SS]KAA2281941.1 4-demethylwyosine synthase TYW1 [Candidatus Nitrosocosmicus sp. SS]KAF0869846.1 4-demethylwyosine synthase TYW1 [Candidatus Nitrosocosmicus sp. SS]MDR4490636.1 4-demethylwyosine synthase TYW1 [Candidatus Nitrosocosmicus sp.]
MSCSGEYYSHNNQGDNLIQITPALKQKLKKAKYGVFNHSAVELCHWTKKSFADEGTCYKHKFYGISTHRCMEMTPTALNCENRCLYCWRPTEFYDTLNMPAQLVDSPDVIVHSLLEERRKLIVGFYGSEGINKSKLDESLFPEHYAISLSGEPTMYPKLPDLIKYLFSLKATKSIFLVTNGQEPEMLQRLSEEDALPTQLYLSTNASNKNMFYKINGPKYKDAWERWLKSLELVSQLRTRTVLRFTLIRDFNTDLNYLDDFANLVKIGSPHFIELKSYMHVGMSTNRLEQSNMLEMAEVKKFAEGLKSKLSNYSYVDESIPSRIVLLQNQYRSIDRWIENYRS